MRRRNFMGLGAAVLAAGSAPAMGASRKPMNIVMILADDLGWMDAAFQGSKFYETPNMDRLAEESMHFTNAYAANPLCSPTRASLMTGQYPARLWLTRAIVPRFYGKEPGPGKFAPPDCKLVEPMIRERLPESEMTIARRLKSAGYTTAIMGKWHLGPEDAKPEKYGFDVNIGAGHYPGPPSYFSPYRNDLMDDGPQGEYLTDRLGEEAEKFIKANRNHPFFLYLSEYAVHHPYQAKKELVDHYAQKDTRGLRQKNEVYAAMIHSMDECVGRVLKTLDREGLRDNTLVIFWSDNGGILNLYGRNELGQARHRDLKPRELITSNAPLRAGKSSIYEGGLRVPAIVRWPGVTRPGSVSDEMVITNDLYPTMLHAAGLKPLPSYPGDGVDIYPVLKGGSLDRDTLYFHFPHAHERPTSAVREGDWKYIHRFGTDKDELYNLKDDIGESRNLIDREPERAAHLFAKLKAWWKETGACLPVPNPNYDPDYDPASVDFSKENTVLGWRDNEACNMEVRDGRLCIIARGGDPMLVSDVIEDVEGPAIFQYRARNRAEGDPIVFWKTGGGGGWSGQRSITIPAVHDGEWKELEGLIPETGRISRLRFDITRRGGLIEIEWIRLLNPKTRKVVKEWDFSRS